MTVREGWDYGQGGVGGRNDGLTVGNVIEILVPQIPCKRLQNLYISLLPLLIPALLDHVSLCAADSAA